VVTEATAPDGSGRFARLPRAGALAVLFALLALVAYGLWLSAHARPAVPPAHAVNGPKFYGAIIGRLRAGEDYERAAVTELRAEHGPLKPFVTVRPPALAVSLSRLPNPLWRALALRAAAAAALLTWTLRLGALGSRCFWLGSTLVLFTGLATPLLAGEGVYLFHEAWAGVLIALSLGLRTDARWRAAAVVGLLAALVRELALPYLLVMVLAALIERRRGEALGFALALAAAGGALAWHAAAETALTRPGDLASPGWLVLDGWDFVLRTAQWNLAIAALGAWAAAVITPLALTGAIGRADGLGLRLALLLVGYSLGFMVIGRPSNAYWGLVTTPLVALGLCFAPAALADLWRAATSPGVPSPLRGEGVGEADG
jgi:hypothetical protein